MRLAGLLLFAAAAYSQQPIDRVLSELAGVRDFREAAISPDGTRVAWVAEVKNKDGLPSRKSEIHAVDLRAESKPRHITAGQSGKPACMERGLAWSPDSSRIAFVSDCAKAGQLQLYVAGAAGGHPRQLTNLTGYLAHPRWSPDGKQIAVQFIENAPRMAGPLEPETPDEGVVEEKFYEQRIAIVDPAASGTAAVRQVSPADLYVYEYDWSPDGKTFAAIAAHGNGDNNWWIADLYTISASSGEAKVIYHPGPQQQMENPRWSPDGKSIAFIGGLMSDEDVTGGEIFVAERAESRWPVRNLTPGITTSVKSIAWPANDRIVFAETHNGASGVSQLHPATGQVERLAQIVGSSRVDLQACKLEYSIVSPK